MNVSLFLSPRFFAAMAAVAACFALGYVWAPLVPLAKLGLLVVALLLAVDVVLLYRIDGLRARRELPDRLSNGDDNALQIDLANRYAFPVTATVIDELPVQLQVRDFRREVALPPGTEQSVRYTVRPTRRGSYAFGAVNVYARTPLGLAERRYRFDEGAEVPVYPSFLQMRHYELLAASERLTEVGVKPMRRRGHTMEFDHIREYVVGDDVRTVNWKATARRDTLMVNTYRDERAQPVYALVDTGRVMKLPFEGMTLLDYSINAALVLCNIALMKGDRAGLVTFGPEVDAIVPAERRGGQIQRLMEALYRVETDFLETDYAALAATLRHKLNARSLLLLFTNFETRSALRRRLPYLRLLARHHVLVVVFFENTELRELTRTVPEDVEGAYVRAIAEKFAFEKRAITEELRRFGIYSILTPPADLSVETINRYLALKAEGTV